MSRYETRTFDGRKAYRRALAELEDFDTYEYARRFDHGRRVQARVAAGKPAEPVAPNVVKLVRRKA